MKKYVLIVFLLTSVFYLNANVQYTYYFDSPVVNDIGDYSLLEFDNTRSAGNVGEPTLPYHPVQLLLPPGEVAESITIISNNEVILQQSVNLYPRQASRPLSSTEPVEFAKEQSVYNSHQAYPVLTHGQLTTEFMNGFGFALSTITPLRYIPAERKLSYFREITVKIKTKPDPDHFTHSEQVTSREKTVKKIADFAQNEDMISRYASQISREGEYEILIITADQFSSDFDSWMELNRKKGFRTELTTIEDINSSMTGQDEQERIRNYIIQEYTDHDIQFVLLGGDAEVLPPRGFYCYVQSGGGMEDYAIPADVYYSGLDGTWNDDNDNQWAEPGEDDLLPDVSVARLPFSNSTELAVMLSKSFDYQVDPVLGEMQNTLLVGENMYNDPLTWGGDYMDLLIGWHDDNGYITEGIPVDHTYETLYDRDLGTWNVPQLMAEINEGKPFIYHAGHCNYDYNMRMDISDITNANFPVINGIDHNYINIYSHGCNCAGFDDNDCIAEEMLKITNFAATFVGNSRYGWFNEGQTEGPSQHLNREFTDALYSDKTDLVAQTHLESKIDTSPWVTAPGQWEEGALRWCFYCCNVLGDPTLPIWTDEPTDITAAYSAAILYGVDYFDVNVSSSGVPMQGLKCTLVQNDEFIGTAVTDASGNATIQFDATAVVPGEINLYITGYNCGVTEYDLMVVPAGYYVQVADHSISSGNDDVLEFGENALLSLTLTEMGNIGDIHNLTVEIFCSDNNISINDDFENVGTLNSGASIDLMNAFDFDISENMPNEHEFMLEIQLDSDEGQWNSSLDLIAYNADIHLESLFVIDNNNSTPDPGEEVTIELELKNEGGADAYNLIPSISTNNPFVILTMLPINIDSLNANSTETYSVCTLQIDAAAPLGEIIDFDFELTGDNGIYISDIFSLVVGLDIEDFESGDFSNHNWNFGGSADWQIDTNSYEGFYSARSGDIGNNSFSSLFIILNVTQESELSFWKKISSEENYDYFQFYIDGDLMDEWSGEVDWSQETYSIPAGNHAFQWKYIKDQGVANGEDCAWLDYIFFPVTTQPSGSGDAEIPVITQLYGNYPNPFNPSTTISFTIAEIDGNSEIIIYNLKGQKIRTFQIEPSSDKLLKSVTWDGTDENNKPVASGVYFYKLRAEGFQQSRKMLLLK